MKQIKMILTAVAIFAVVGGALAFKSSAFSARDVYCASSGDFFSACPVNDIVNFRLDPAGSAVNPCVGGLTEHINTGNPAKCVDQSQNLPKISSALGSN